MERAKKMAAYRVVTDAGGGTPRFRKQKGGNQMAKTNPKRLTAWLLSLVLLLGLFPITAQAYDDTYDAEVPSGTAYVDLYIDGGQTYYRQSNSDINLDWVRLFDGYCLSSNTEKKPTKYTDGDPYVARVADGTLYLNGYHGTTTNFSSYVSGVARGIEMTFGVNQICVEQDSSVTVSGTNKEAYGIWRESDLTITGPGKLTVNAMGNDGYSRGIYTSSSLTVSAPLNVTAERYGLYTARLTLSGSADKTVAVTGFKNATVCGVYLNSVNDGDHTISGSLTVDLPTDTEALGTGNGCGIYIPERSGDASVSLTNASVTINNGKYGIFDASVTKSSGARVVVSDSTLNITSTEVYDSCNGIRTKYNGLEITDGSTVNITTNGAPISILSDTAGVTIRNSNAELTNTISPDVVRLQTAATNTTSMNVIDLAEGCTVTLKGGGSLTGGGSAISRVKLGSDTYATSFLSREENSTATGSYNYVGVKEGDYAVVSFAHGKEVFPPTALLTMWYTNDKDNLTSAEISKSSIKTFTHQILLELGVGYTDLTSFVRGDGYYCVLGRSESITPATEWTKMTKGKYIVLGEEVSTKYDNYAVVYVRYQYSAFGEGTLRWSSPSRVGIFEYIPLKDVVPFLSPWDNSGRTITVDNANRTVVIGGASTDSVAFYTDWPDGTAVGDKFNAIKMWNSSGMSYSSIGMFYVTPKSGGMGQKVAAVVKDVTIDGTTYIKGATASANYTITCPNVKATYKLTLKNCTATVDGKAVTSGSYVEEGATVTVTAELAGDYKLNYWSVTGNPSLPQTDTVTFTMPGKDTTAEAILYTRTFNLEKVYLKNVLTASKFSDLSLTNYKTEYASPAVVWYDESGAEISADTEIDPSKNYRGHITVTCEGDIIFKETYYLSLETDTPGGNLTRITEFCTRSDNGRMVEFDVYLINLPQVTIPLYKGEALPEAGDCTVSELKWPGTGNAAESYTITSLKVAKTDNRTMWGKAAMTLSVNRTEQMNVTTGDSTLTLTNATLSAPERPTGVTVSGTVTSYGDASEAVTVTLTPASGTPLSTTVSNGAYTFTEVPAGEYTLKVEKKGHAPWTETITVGDADITGKDVTVCLWGDVNKDGRVNSTDALWVRQNSAGGRVLDAYQKILADLNRDDKVNSTDALWIRQISAGSRTLTY